MACNATGLGLDLPFGFAGGNGFPGAGRTLFRRHRFQGSFAADLAALRALLAEELQDFGRKLFLRHAMILRGGGLESLGASISATECRASANFSASRPFSWFPVLEVLQAGYRGNVERMKGMGI